MVATPCRILAETFILSNFPMFSQQKILSNTIIDCNFRAAIAFPDAKATDICQGFEIVTALLHFYQVLMNS